MIPTGLQTGTPVLPNGGWGRSVAWRPTGQHVAVLSSLSNDDNPSILIYDASDWSLVFTSHYAGWNSNYIRWTPDGRYLIVCGTGYHQVLNETVYTGFSIFDAEDGFAWSDPADVGDDLDHMMVSEDGQYLVTISNYVRVFSTATWTQLVQYYSAGMSNGEWIDISPDNSQIAIAVRNDPHIRLLNFDTGTNTISEGVTLAIGGTPDFGRSVRFSADGQYLFATSTRSPYRAAYDTVTGAQQFTYNTGYRYTTFRASDDTFLCTRGSSGIERWTPGTWTREDVVGVRDSTIVNDISFSPDGDYMAVAFNDSPGIEIYGPPPVDMTIDATLDDTAANVEMRSGADYVYAFLADSVVGVTAAHGVEGPLSVDLQGATAAVTGETFLTLTITVDLADTTVAIGATHEPNARYVDMSGAVDTTLEWAWAAEFPLVGLATATVETFYNPQEELTEAGTAALQMIVAYVQEETLAGTAEGQLESRVAALHWLRARAEGSLELDLQLMFEGTLAALAGDEVAEAFAALAQETGTATLTPATMFALQVTDELAAELIPQATLLISVEETLDAEAGDSVQALGHYLQNVKDAAAAWLVFKVSGEVVQGWVMNLEGERPFSEYSEFDFNSMTRIGGNYFAASDAGLHMLGGDTDDGEQIDASLSSMMLDFDTSAQKRVVAAYLGYTSDGTVVLKVRSVDDGKLVEHWYEAAEVTADAPRAGYRPLGRGLKSRYWQFELANVDGSDFEIDKLELQPIKLSRRV